GRALIRTPARTASLTSLQHPRDSWRTPDSPKRLFCLRRWRVPSRTSPYGSTTSTATTRPPAVTLALEAFYLLLAILGGEALADFNSATFETQAFAIEECKQDRSDDPAQHHHIGEQRSGDAKSMHQP